MLYCKHSATTPERSNQISSSLEIAHDSRSSSLVSQEPDDCGANKAPVVPDAHNMNEETLQCHTGLSTTARTQEQENQLKDSSTMDTHILVETCNDGFDLLSYMKLDNGHYRKLAEFMMSVCDHLVTVIPDYTDKINHIKQMLESTIEIYNNQSEESMEKANEDVQLQYEELKDMLENLPLSEPQLLSMYIDGLLNGMQFHSVVGPYSPYNLVQAIRRINRSNVHRSRCSIM